MKKKISGVGIYNTLHPDKMIIMNPWHNYKKTTEVPMPWKPTSNPLAALADYQA